MSRTRRGGWCSPPTASWFCTSAPRGSVRGADRDGPESRKTRLASSECSLPFADTCRRMAARPPLLCGCLRRHGGLRGSVRLRRDLALRRVQGGALRPRGHGAVDLEHRSTDTSSRVRRPTAIRRTVWASTSIRSCSFRAAVLDLVEPGVAARRPGVGGCQWSAAGLLARAQASRVVEGGRSFCLRYLLYPATQFNAFTIGDGFHSVSLARAARAVCDLVPRRGQAGCVLGRSPCSLPRRKRRSRSPSAVSESGTQFGRGHRLFGLSVFAVGLGVTLFNFFWVIPHFSRPVSTPSLAGTARSAGRPEGMAHKLVTDPLAFVHAVATGHKAFYVIVLFVPFLGLWLLEPLLLLGAVPELVIDLLSSQGNQTSIGYQYTAGIAPFVVAASIFGAARFRQSGGTVSPVGACGHWPGRSPQPDQPSAMMCGHWGRPLVSAKAHALSLIPGWCTAVSASNELGGHLSERRYIYTFPSSGGRAGSSWT